MGKDQLSSDRHDAERPHFNDFQWDLVGIIVERERLRFRALPSDYIQLAEHVKHLPEVEAALDAYASAVKAWGVTDNTPRRLMEAESVMLARVMAAAERRLQGWKWVRCSPELLALHINTPNACRNLPRRDGDGTYSHDHLVRDFS